MHVLKFGGSSIGTADRIGNVLQLIIDRAGKGESLSVIFSAYQGITDQLIDMGQRAEGGDDSYKELLHHFEERHIQTADALISLKGRSHVLTHIKILLNDLEEILYGIYLIRELTAKTLDYLLSFGERLSGYTISECLKDRGIDNRFIDSRTLVKTDNQYGKARVMPDVTEKNIRNEINGQDHVYIITGFIASTVNDETTTLGRGGSDFSASLFGAALEVQEIEIWTDVDGVLTADPRKVPDAFSIDQMTYEEAMELSHFGARVIHPPTMQPALDKKLPIRILNTFNPSFPGTLITDRVEENRFIIKGISSIDAVALLQIRGSGMIGSTGIAERIFNALAKNDINIILISQASSEHSICLAIQPEASARAKMALEDELKYEIHYEMINEIAVEPDMAIIAVVGENMRQRKGIAGRVFQTLGENGINISAIAQGSSELNISMVIAREDETRALNVLHRAFFDNGQKGIHIFLTGTGLVGGAFIRQIAALQKKDPKAQLMLCGICNTRKMLVDRKDIASHNWEEKLDAQGHASDVALFVKEAIRLALPRSVFVDGTSSDTVVDLYPEILDGGMSIVTPNKIANTRDTAFFSAVKGRIESNNVRYAYETTVGAGLPVIKTLRDLIDSGDHIMCIEGVLSGTMSYLFNTYDGSVPFAGVVRKAQELGYTEPDPRSDLSGLDVKRKLLILIREAGLAFELNHIVMEDLLPEAVNKAPDIDAFYNELGKVEEVFAARIKKADKEGKKLRYIARFRDGQARVSLEAVSADHPFYNLRGSENIIAFTTGYYQDYPLVIKGPGAGAEVTALGVLTDVLKVGKGLQ